MPKYMTIALDQPWGKEEVKVRTFPPCEVKDSLNNGNSVTIFANRFSAKTWRRETVYNYGYWPSRGFIAWDDTNGEYAWHEVGTIHVPKAIDPLVPGFKPIIRGESETVGARSKPKSRSERQQKGSLRDRFMRWWDSLSGPDDTPEFLRKDAR